MAQMLRGACAGSVMPHSSTATMSQCSSAVTKRSRLSGFRRSQCSSFENPHSEEYVPPHHSIASSLAPPGGFGDQRRFTRRAMIAPEVVVVERNQPLADRNHARSGGVERDRLRSDRPPRPRPSAPSSSLPRAPPCGPHGSASRNPDLRACDGEGIRRAPSRAVRASLSTMETRTLRVPKSAPATRLIGASTSASPGTWWRPHAPRRPSSRNWRRRDARTRFRRYTEAAPAISESRPRPRRRTSRADRK